MLKGVCAMRIGSRNIKLITYKHWCTYNVDTLAYVYPNSCITTIIRRSEVPSARKCRPSYVSNKICNIFEVLWIKRLIHHHLAGWHFSRNLYPKPLDVGRLTVSLRKFTSDVWNLISNPSASIKRQATIES